MANAKFTAQQITVFNDRIQNCLNDVNCRQIFKSYLRNRLRDSQLMRTLQLWELVAGAESWDEEEMIDLIDDIDNFNQNPLLSIAECAHKLEYARRECCRILDRVLPSFIQYLNRHHRT